MIDQLHTSLRALTALPVQKLGSAQFEQLRSDCADALRLQLDCMQADLTAAERDVLRLLNEQLERPELEGPQLASALQAALAVLSAAK